MAVLASPSCRPESPPALETFWRQNQGRTVLQGGSWEPNGSVCPGEVWLGRGRWGSAGGSTGRRQPEGTVLYEVVRDNLATLLAEASEVGRGLPWHVERDFAKYLLLRRLPAPARRPARGLPFRLYFKVG